MIYSYCLNIFGFCMVVLFILILIHCWWLANTETDYFKVQEYRIFVSKASMLKNWCSKWAGRKGTDLEDSNMEQLIAYRWREEKIIWDWESKLWVVLQTGMTIGGTRHTTTPLKNWMFFLKSLWRNRNIKLNNQAQTNLHPTMIVLTAVVTSQCLLLVLKKRSILKSNTEKSDNF